MNLWRLTIVTSLFIGAFAIQAGAIEAMRLAADPALSPDGKRLLFAREGITWWRKGYHDSRAGQCYDGAGRLTPQPFEHLNTQEIHAFDLPGPAGEGRDWVLVLDDARRSFPAPGRARVSLTGPGLLDVHPTNFRYFRDTSTGKAVYLTGVDNFRAMQDWTRFGVGDFDFNAFLDDSRSHQQNFLRLWVWEHHYNSGGSQGTYCVKPPHVFKRTGPGTAIDGLPKFDLTCLDQKYFDRLRHRVIAAGERGIWVSIMLFQGFSLDQYAWNGHPFNAANNINGIEGDADNDGEGYETHTLNNRAIVAIQEVYVKKVIDSVWDLDNVLYEVANESLAKKGKINSLGAIVDWQYYLIDLIHKYELATYGRQHPVGMTMIRDKNNSVLFASPAEWVSPGGRWVEPVWQSNPPAADGSKVVIADTDHIHPDQSGGVGFHPWVWMCFTRGLNINAVDGDNESEDWCKPEDLQVMADTRRYANLVDLATMTPQNFLSSTTFCLASPGKSYIVYQPNSGLFTVNLVSGTYSFEWFKPGSSSVAGSGTFNASAGENSFEPPFGGDAVLFLESSQRGFPALGCEG